MNCSCAIGDSSPYATGIIRETSERLAHPGGRALTAHALERASVPAGAWVLDLGCGAGETLVVMHALGYRALGIDPQASIKMRNGAIIRARAEELPFQDASFDAILAECSLSVTEDQRRVLSECARVLAPDGRLIVCDLYARNPASIAQVRSLAGTCIAGMIVREEFEAKLSAAGFSIDLWEDRSRALSEFVARMLMYGGSLASLWNCADPAASGDKIEAAMRAVRAGYFLAIATRKSAHRREP